MFNFIYNLIRRLFYGLIGILFFCFYFAYEYTHQKEENTSSDVIMVTESEDYSYENKHK